MGMDEQVLVTMKATVVLVQDGGGKTTYPATTLQSVPPELSAEWIADGKAELFEQKAVE